MSEEVGWDWLRRQETDHGKVWGWVWKLFGGDLCFTADRVGLRGFQVACLQSESL